MNEHANYMQVGRWGQCAWCGTIYQPTHSLDAHFCGAPWQQRADDIPADWTPGVSPLTTMHYPHSPFCRPASEPGGATPVAWRYRPKVGTPVGWLFTPTEIVNVEHFDIEPLYAAPPSDAALRETVRKELRWLRSEARACAVNGRDRMGDELTVCADRLASALQGGVK